MSNVRNILRLFGAGVVFVVGVILLFAVISAIAIIGGAACGYVVGWVFLDLLGWSLALAIGDFMALGALVSLCTIGSAVGFD